MGACGSKKLDVNDVTLVVERAEATPKPAPADVDGPDAPMEQRKAMSAAQEEALRKAAAGGSTRAVDALAKYEKEKAAAAAEAEPPAELAHSLISEF